ncbi:MAG: LCP family protein [bacterium]|nr:LCP family protein [bacterium]
MDNSRAPKKAFNSSVDGFVDARPNSYRPGLNLRAFDKYYNAQKNARKASSLPSSHRRIDTFSSVDGFRSIKTPPINSPGDVRQPLEISDAFTDRQQRHERIKKQTAELKKHKTKQKAWWSRLWFKKPSSAFKRPKLRMAMRTSAVLGSIIVLVGAGIFLRAFLTGRDIFKGGGNSAILNNQDVDPSLLKGEGDGRVNILVLGKGGAEQSDGPDLTDTIMVASIDPIAKEAALLSVPRDFWVKSPSGYESKVNEVYANAKTAVLDNYSYGDRNSFEAKAAAEKAGVEALKKTLSESLGVPIHYHAMIDFAGFKKAIDTVGGIDINVSEEMAVTEYNMWIGGQSYNLDVKPGLQHFDGMRALAFSRSRKTSAKGDFARSERQRAVILGLKEKALSTGTLANPIKLNQLISDFGDQISTDFSVNEIMRIYELSKEIPSDKIVSVGLDELVVGSMVNGLSVQIPKAGMFNYTEIQNYVRNVMKDAFLRKEDAKIIILNGTETAGLATKKSNELKSFGYNVISVGDAPSKTYTDTLLIDMKKGDFKYTLSYLEKRLNLKAIETLPDTTIDATAADFVIIIGSNETSSSQN